MADEPPDSLQRWTAKSRAVLVLIILRSEPSANEVARHLGLTVAEVGEGGERFIYSEESALRAWPKDEEALKGEWQGLAQHVQRRSPKGLDAFEIK